MPDDLEPPVRDYRETIFLPKTDFPMRGGLPQLEPRILERWGDLYSQTRAAAAGRRTRRCSCCTTGRPTPTARSTSATRWTSC